MRNKHENENRLCQYGQLPVCRVGFLTLSQLLRTLSGLMLPNALSLREWRGMHHHLGHQPLSTADDSSGYSD